MHGRGGGEKGRGYGVIIISKAKKELKRNRISRKDEGVPLKPDIHFKRSGNHKLIEGFVSTKDFTH